ncbi:hypothetical protein Poli38472_013147 [Pythium oligandrum]|uniref:Uncharacterized protein n=1 Tax=Pythium oligandrum TaxID=41045 RepID=A0A8K1C2H7_PYTOL|nr:hypothetical protein Poli38472_013147 [Pythium oligandrum]|eukprot:TMW55256.1 hypothetical protein Poli38472_013147 [Pythium oligandrum]
MNPTSLSSPATVDMALFDSSFWMGGADDVSMDMTDFGAISMKPVDMSLTADMIMSTDEDAWLFAAGKPEIAIGDIQVVAMPQADAIKCEPVDEDDATNVLLTPIVGSPVDELDAMTAFMVDFVDPFQEVVVTSDEEPSSPIKNGGLNSFQDIEKRVERLRAKVAHLDKMYYARCQGRLENAVMAQNDMQRVKLVRSVERLQRVACGLAQDNYRWRSDSTTRVERDAMFLEEMELVLNGPATMEPLRAAVLDKVCSDVIVATAKRAAEVATDVKKESVNMMGWEVAKNVQDSGLHSYSIKKDFFSGDMQTVTDATWDLVSVPEKFAALSSAAGKAVKASIIKVLSDDAVVVTMDAVHVDEDGVSCVEREVCVAFRVRTNNSVMLAISSLPPSMWEDKLYALDTVSYIQKGMRWMQFTPSKNDQGFSVTHGGHLKCASRAAAEAESLRLLSLIARWEAKFLSPLIQLF